MKPKALKSNLVIIILLYITSFTDKMENYQ